MPQQGHLRARTWVRGKKGARLSRASPESTDGSSILDPEVVESDQQASSTSDADKLEHESLQTSSFHSSPEPCSRASSSHNGLSPSDGNNQRLQSTPEPNSPTESFHNSLEFPGRDRSHSLRLPIKFLPPPTPPYLIELCVHPDWRPLSPRTVVHLINDRVASLSQEGLHSSPQHVTTCPTIAVWRDLHADSAGSDLSNHDSQRSPEPSTPESFVLLPQSTQPPSLHWVGIKIFLAILGIMGTVLYLFRSCNSVGLQTRTAEKQTRSLTLWTPLNDIYRDYTHTLLPLMAHFQQNSSFWTPSSIIYGLMQEASTLQGFMMGWESKSIPVPQALPGSPPFLDQLKSTHESLKSIHRDIFFIKQTAPLLGGSTSLSILITMLQDIYDDSNATTNAEEQITLRAVRVMKNSLQHIEQRNELVLLALQRIQHQLEQSIRDYTRLLDEFDPLRQHIDRAHWIVVFFDAVDFSRDFLLPKAILVCHLVEVAATALLSADLSLGLALEEYNMLEAGKGQVEQITLRYTNKWLRKSIIEEKIIINFILNISTIAQLQKVQKHGTIFTSVLTQLEEEGKEKSHRTFPNTRPPRPSWL
ncbi:hypothetical protein G7046_g6901 [Stylonectria norvegica]|nr:hypothetical protein G7046_g6901 [Stylonectria norvegica]